MGEARRDWTGEDGAAPGRRLLLLDTCGAEGSLALAEERGGNWAVVGAAVMAGRSASERLIPELQGLLRQRRWETASLAAIAVVCGPGSFTGIRVGLSAAKGLCDGLGIPLVVVSRLEVLARRVAGQGRVHAVLDAGRGDVYWGRFCDGQSEGEEMVPAGVLLERVGSEMVVACEERVVEELAGVGVRRVTALRASDALGMAAERLADGDLGDWSTADGNYLRRTEVEIRRRMEEQDRGRTGRVDG